MEKSNKAKDKEKQPLIPVQKIPNPEVFEKPQKRRFSAEYKLKILREADTCQDGGEIGALLRREGIYSSYLTAWRRQQEEGTLNALGPQKRGRKGKRKDPLATRVEELERENQKLKKRLKQTETIIEVQKKISEALGIPAKSPEEEEND